MKKNIRVHLYCVLCDNCCRGSTIVSLCYTLFLAIIHNDMCSEEQHMIIYPVPGEPLKTPISQTYFLYLSHTHTLSFSIWLFLKQHMIYPLPSSEGATHHWKTQSLRLTPSISLSHTLSLSLSLALSGAAHDIPAT